MRVNEKMKIIKFIEDQEIFVLQSQEGDVLSLKNDCKPEVNHINGLDYGDNYKDHLMNSGFGFIEAKQFIWIDTEKDSNGNFQRLCIFDNGVFWLVCNNGVFQTNRILKNGFCTQVSLDSSNQLCDIIRTEFYMRENYKYGVSEK